MKYREYIVEKTENKRLLIITDIHNCHANWYGMENDDRMELMCAALRREYDKAPYDAILCLGDYSLDFWGGELGGSYLWTPSVSRTTEFVEKYLPKFPTKSYMIPGNHEQYSDEQWLALTGNARQGAMGVGGRLFIFLDNFGGNLDPDYHHDGKYVGVDMDFVNEQLSLYPDKDVWLIAHYFDMEKESDEFRQLLKTNDRIRGLFQGHTHLTTPIALGKQYNDLVIAQTGNFAYTKDANIVGSFWGFRDLVITEDGAASRYIIAESEAVIDGKLTHVERSEIRVVEYE